MDNLVASKIDREFAFASAQKLYQVPLVSKSQQSLFFHFGVYFFLTKWRRIVEKARRRDDYI